MYKLINQRVALTLIIGLIGLGGCAAPQQQWSTAAQNQQTSTGVQVKPSQLGVPTTPSIEYIRIKTENSIFLDPPEGNTNIYVRIGDTSGRDWGGLDMSNIIKSELQNRGYTPVRNAKNAAYSLQVNIRLADEVSAAELAKLDETRYGSDISGIIGHALGGAVIGGVGSGLTGGNADSVLVGAAGGALLGGVSKAIANQEKRKLILAQQSTKFFSLITDVELRERAQDTVTRSGETEIASGQLSVGSDTLADDALLSGQTSSTTQTETYTETSTWKRYHTRMLGKAKGKLVVFEDVQQDFAVRMARAIAGIF